MKPKSFATTRENFTFGCWTLDLEVSIALLCHALSGKNTLMDKNIVRDTATDLSNTPRAFFVSALQDFLIDAQFKKMQFELYVSIDACLQFILDSS